ncbi:MAG: PLDc N-terminal domain-containing protein [Verrucomicrobiales bacterium]
MYEILVGIGTVAALIFAGYAVGCCWREEGRPFLAKIFYTVFILLVPVGGALVYFRIRVQEAKLVSELGNRKGRRGRRRYA